MNEGPRIRALDELERRLTAAEARPHRYPTRRVAAVAVAVTAAIATPGLAAAGVVDLGFDFGENVPERGTANGPPAVVADPARSVDVLAVLLGTDGVNVLRETVGTYGMRVEVDERVVAPAAVGRILGVQYPRSARFDSKHRLVLDQASGGTIIVTRGQAAPAGRPATTEGLTLYEVLPQVRAAVTRDDPRRTLEQLRSLGYDIEIKLVVDNPDRTATAVTGVKTVSSPPEGTVVLSVLNSEGGNTATAQTHSLILEVAPAGSRVAAGHR